MSGAWSGQVYPLANMADEILDEVLSGHATFADSLILIGGIWLEGSG